MSIQDTMNYAQYLLNHGHTVVSASIVVDLLDHIDAQDAALASQRRDTLLEAADAVDAHDRDVDWEELTEAAGRRHAADQIVGMAQRETGPLLEKYRARIINEIADRAQDVINCGDVAEVAAPVQGESGRAAAVDGRDSLYEDPVAWLRALAGDTPWHPTTTTHEKEQ